MGGPVIFVMCNKATGESRADLVVLYPGHLGEDLEGLCPAWISKPFESTFTENLIRATNPHWGWEWG